METAPAVTHPFQEETFNVALTKQRRAVPLSSLHLWILQMVFLKVRWRGGCRPEDFNPNPAAFVLQII